MSDKNSAAEHQPLRSSAALERLGPFAGEWKLEFTGFHGDPATVARGRSSFRWLENGASLLQHAEVPNSDFPSAFSAHLVTARIRLPATGRRPPTAP
jgi:hypothetical protein